MSKFETPDWKTGDSLRSVKDFLSMIGRTVLGAERWENAYDKAMNGEDDL